MNGEEEEKREKDPAAENAEDIIICGWAAQVM